MFSACSYSSTSNPRFSNASPAVNPPNPAPAMTILGLRIGVLVGCLVDGFLRRAGSPLRRKTLWLVPGYNACEGVGAFRQAVASPHDVEVRTHQDVVEAVDVARRAWFDVENGERCADGRECRIERRRVGAALPQPHQRVAVPDAIMDRQTGLEPDMRQPGAGPGCRHVSLDLVRRPRAG